GHTAAAVLIGLTGAAIVYAAIWLRPKRQTASTDLTTLRAEAGARSTLEQPVYPGPVRDLPRTEAANEWMRAVHRGLLSNGLQIDPSDLDLLIRVARDVGPFPDPAVTA
ncbi:MAG: hypothetical protein ACRC8U_06500, partial [Brooklawnia sp.]